MAAFFTAQLDYIYFVYGLALVLLGAVCFALHRTVGRDLPWRLLGVFGISLGLYQWLGAFALGLGDTLVFYSLRTALLATSFISLVEFWRRGAAQSLDVYIGNWIFVLLVLALGAILWAGDAAAVDVAVRYVFGVAGALGASVILLLHARGLDGARRLWLILTALGFALYAFASGIVVPAASFAPASILNEEIFFRTSGVPVQVVRTALACLLTVSIWAYAQASWSSGNVAGELNAARRHFVWTTLVLLILVGLGWVTTNYLGRLSHKELRHDLDSDMSLLTRMLSAETTAADNVASAMTQAPVLRNYFLARDQSSSAPANIAVDSFRTAAGPSEIFLADLSGRVVISSRRTGAVSFIGVQVEFRPYFKQARAGTPGAYFARGSRSYERGYYSSAPIYGQPGAVVGIAVVKKALDSFEEEMRRCANCFLISADGVVFLAGRQDMLYRTLWPLDDFTLEMIAKSQQFGALNTAPVFSAEILDGEWVWLDGQQLLAGRRLINDAGWSLLQLAPSRATIVNRLFGITITLLICSVALAYYVALQRRIDAEMLLETKQDELEKLARELERQATTDALTGVYNRLKLNALLADEMDRAARYNVPLSIVMYDVDFFKAINDKYGHQTGDTVLTKVTQLIAANLRHSDALARWGGEEFMIVAPNTTLEHAADLAEKLRLLASHADLGVPQTLTCSFAVTQYRNGESVESLTARADELLYRAKHGGRNRVEQAA